MRLLILLLSIVTLASCGIKKELSKTKLQLKAVTEREKETQDSNRLLKSEVATYQAAMKESEYGEIEFVPEAAPCNCDSIKTKPAPATIESEVVWNVAAKWTSVNLPTVHDASALTAIFSCPNG